MRRRKWRVRTDGKLTYELSEHEKERRNKSLSCMVRLDPEDAYVFDPPEEQRITKSGAWVMIVRQLPPIERGFQDNIRVARVFWVEQEEGTDESGFRSDGSYKVLCRSPWGDVHLWPYEYWVIAPERLIALWQDCEVIFHPMAIELSRFNDVVFYARSRGIGVADAIVMALGSLKGPVGWFEPTTPELARACEEMEERVHRWKPKRGGKHENSYRDRRAQGCPGELRSEREGRL